VLVQPAALVRGLAATLPENVEGSEEAPVHELRLSDGLHVKSHAGSVSAKGIVLATNGLVPAFGFLKRRVVPVLTFASLTRPLREDEEAALGGNREWGLVPGNPMGTTVRRGCQGRILIRNTVFYTPRLQIHQQQRRKVLQNHMDSFRARFPALHDVKLEYTWGGLVGVSINDAQFFGRVAPGVFASAGYNGVGLAMGTISGRLLADLAVGCDSELLDNMRRLPGPGWMPPNPLLGVGLRAALGFLQARAGAAR
jgi:glycine/D-amino acid oxidase-like deaminating enzyme